MAVTSVKGGAKVGIFYFLTKKVKEMFGRFIKTLYLCTRFRETKPAGVPAPRLSKGALSSAGSERLPYKQRVGGSNPSAPT